MKNTPPTFLLLVFLAMLAFACNRNKQVKIITLDSLTDPKPAPDSNVQQTIKTEIDSMITDTVAKSPLQDTINVLAQNALTALKNKDYQTFAGYFHPAQPVLFSPDGLITKSSCKQLLAKDFLESIDKNWTLSWGVYKGSGQKIQLKVIPYIEQFIYDVDFANAPKTALNSLAEKGNSTNNIPEIFPKQPYIDYHFNEANSTFKSLRLVFKKHNGQYYIVGIIHDEGAS